MFLEFAKMVAEEFSCNFFANNLGFLLNFYAKEKSKDVALTYSRNVCAYRLGIGNTTNAFSPGTSPQKNFEEIL